MTAVGTILDRLQGVRKSGDGWIARCPAHEDKNPSLSISERDGKILLHCHAGCTFDSIRQTLQVEPRDLFEDQPQTPTIRATYDYTDERGKLLYQVVRYEPKDFRQRRPDGNGGWTWNLHGVRRVPYRLPEILAAKFVVLTEGEKDVESARTLKFKATCNAGGAGKWTSDYSEYLCGKRVLIVADADEPGRKHAEQVAISLQGKAAATKVVELPGAKDLTEWIEKGGTQEQLLDLIEKVPDWKPNPAKQKLQNYGCSQFLSSRFEDGGQPLVGQGEEILVPRCGRVLIVGKPKSLKSQTAFAIGFEAACGFQVLGKFRVERPVRTLYAQFEDRRSDIQKRLQKFVHSHDGICPTDDLLHITVGRAFDLGHDANKVELEGLLESVRPELLVMDVMRVLFPGDVKEGHEVQPFLDYLDSICERFKTALILVHYTAKNANGGPSAAGSVYLDGWPDLLVELKNKRRVMNHTTAEMCFRSRGAESEPVQLVYDETASPILVATKAGAGDMELVEARKFLGSGWGIRELSEAIDCSYHVSRRLIETWLEDRKVQVTHRTGRGGKKRFEFVQMEAENNA